MIITLKEVQFMLDKKKHKDIKADFVEQINNIKARFYIGSL